ncbi:MAG: hypothetical protein M5R42_21190 [Rhodocyclaceae bacterium]|nr:hypothetical protein [Rhodocyclaceae bacterium]
MSHLDEGEIQRLRDGRRGQFAAHHFADHFQSAEFAQRLDRQHVGRQAATAQRLRRFQPFLLQDVGILFHHRVSP